MKTINTVKTYNSQKKRFVGRVPKFENMNMPSPQGGHAGD